MSKSTAPQDDQAQPAEQGATYPPSLSTAPSGPISASSSSRLRLPSPSHDLTNSRHSTGEHSIVAAYPSASEDYIGSYYYGRYDHEQASSEDEAQQTRPGTSASAWAPSHEPSSSLSHDEPREARIAPADPGSSLRQSTDLGDSHVLRPNDLILASPEELQRADYFGRSAVEPGTGLAYWPHRQRTDSSAQSVQTMAMMGNSQWNASESEMLPVLGFAGTPGRDPDMARLHANTGHDDETGGNGASKSVGFMTESPDDLEDSPRRQSRQRARRSSGDVIADAGGDTQGMRQAKSGLDRLRKSFRRVSNRVVDVRNALADDPQDHVRLADDGSDSSDAGSEHDAPTAPARPLHDDATQSAPPPVTHVPPLGLRGKSLGFIGPDNRFRQAMARLLAYWWVEPLILGTIITNLVMVIIQSGRDVFKHPRKPAFFEEWENIALLALFSVYTIEMVAKIIVSGLFINPPRPAQRYDAFHDDKLSLKQSSHGDAPSTVGTAQGRSHRREMSRSNTLDAWSQLGGSLKTRAQQALNPEGAQSLPRPEARRKSTMQSTMSESSHVRSGTIGTMKSATMSYRPPTLHAIDESESKDPFGPTVPQHTTFTPEWQASKESSKILRAMQEKAVPFSSAIVVQRSHVNEYAYLRHSWNRVDCFAVVCFWVSFILSMTHQEVTDTRHLYLFQALSVLRCARLLTITSGTSRILQSLKLAAPLLWNVLFFVLFAMTLFSIIGIQSFKGSYRRSCVWLGDANSGIDADPGQNYTLSQICGGWKDASGQSRSHFTAKGFPAPVQAKGFLCPVGQICQEADANPQENSQSFDNIFTSLLEVVIVISSNGWSGAMYDMIDADYFVSSLFFILGIIILNFWLANLFVAVITNSFATISSQTHQSAFSKQNIDETLKSAGEKTQADTLARRRRKKAASVYKRVWGYTHFFWLAAIIASLSFQASSASYASESASNTVEAAELYLTVAFDVEILLRFISYVLDDDWRSFFNGYYGGRNKVDLGLCVITSIIQIPAIRHSDVYPWLTIFQLQRFYRVIIAAPRMERLLLRVFGSLSGLLNMILFLLLTVGLAALVAVKMFRGDIPATSDGEDTEVTFKHLFNSFLAMYQVFSSENWNDVLFGVISSVDQFKGAVLAGIFIAGWFLFANFLVLQMFIAVINEGFSFSEAERRRQQLDHYLKRLDPKATSATGRFLHKLSPYRWLKARNEAIMNQSSTHSVDSHAEASAHARKRTRRRAQSRSLRSTASQVWDFVLDATVTVRRLLRLDRPEDSSVPLDTVRQRKLRQSLSGHEMLQNRMSTRHPSMYDAEPTEEDEAAREFARERQLHRMRSNLGLLSEKPTQQQINAAHIASHEDNPQIAMAKAINEHPSFDTTLWLFTNHSKFRRFCQSLVPSSYGHRIFGRQHVARRFMVVQIVIFVAIVASVVVAGIAAPLYRKDWYGRHGFRRDSWFSLAEVFLSLVFFFEFFIKVVADGFAFTPNAYLLSPWNLLDLLVLATLVINVSTELAVIGGVSRFTRAIKAFRALRLINLSARMRSTFENLVIGGGRFVDAGILAILYIIPFAVWGQNLFSGLLYSCTDGSSGISSKSDCLGEYSASPSQWTFLAPRVWENPTSGSSYSFDDFKSALLILFEIVSLEGWIDVMTAAMAIVGPNQQPSTDATQVNALFFVIYNLIGAVFVLTLFVSVIIEGFQSATGAAFLSTEQRQWIDLKRLIARQRPSRRPTVPPTSAFRAWCHNRATRKHDWWGRLMTASYIGNLITLCTQSYDQDPSSEHIRDAVYLCLAVLYATDLAIRFFGLGWHVFRRSWWCIFDSIVVVGIFGNTLPLLVSSAPVQSNIQLQKIFLTAATLKLVAKHNGLNQLFKTAISGLPAIISLLGLWMCFFFFFAIMFVEIFGLTKWGKVGPETYSRNFSSLPHALIFLSMMTTGEGWNSYMHDYTVEPPSCTPSANYLETDCGSTGWAYFLFIGWNVTSMYIFLNMFTGTVVENFSYIFQLGGKPVLGREDVRGFKRTWLQVAGTSKYMPPDKFAQFFSSLPGKFDLRIHPEELSVSALREALTGDERASIASFSSPRRNKVAGAMSRLRAGHLSPISPSSARAQPPWARGNANGKLNVAALQSLLETVTREELQFRRERYTRIWHEAHILASTEGRLSFHEMLTLIAHYKLIDDDVALGPQEFLDRRTMNEKIDDRINLERVRGVMRTTYLRYRFNTLRSERQRVEVEQSTQAAATSSSVGHGTVPEGLPIITVDETQSPPTSPPLSGKQPPQRPTLTLDLGALNSLPDSNAPRTPPNQRAEAPGSYAPYSMDRLAPHGTPSSRSQHSLPGGHDAVDAASTSSHGLSLEELEKRASPLLEQFDDSAWGRFMRRVSIGNSDASAGSHGRSGGDAGGDGSARPLRLGDSSRGSPSSVLSPFKMPWMKNNNATGGLATAGSDSSLLKQQERGKSPFDAPLLAAPAPASTTSFAGPSSNPFYTLDSDNAWGTGTAEARTTATTPSPLSSPTKRHSRQDSMRRLHQDSDDGAP
ncbi:unnamed protein product [Parajaminaea phylloscopi]